MSSNRSAALAVAVLLASGVFWGLTWLPLRHFAAHGVSGPALSLLAYGAVGVVGLPVLWLQRAAWRGQLLLLALIFVLGGAANLCFVSALVYGEVVRVMLLFYLAPMWSVLGGRIFLGERVTVTRVVTVCLSLLGAVFVIGAGAALDAPPSLADGLGLASGFLYALQNVASRAAAEIPAPTKSVAVFLGCGALSGLLMLSLGQTLPPIAPSLAAQLAAFGVWLMMAMWTTMYGVTHLEAGRAGVLLVAELVVAVASAMLIAGERLGALEWLGAGLILVATLLEAHGTTKLAMSGKVPATRGGEP